MRTSIFDEMADKREAIRDKAESLSRFIEVAPFKFYFFVYQMNVGYEVRIYSYWHSEPDGSSEPLHCMRAWSDQEVEDIFKATEANLKRGIIGLSLDESCGYMCGLLKPYED